MTPNQSTPPRVLIGRLYHEAHTFVEGHFKLEDCLITHGDELLAAEGDASALDGLLVTARECNWHVIPSVDVRVKSGEMAEDEVFEYWWQHFSAALDDALQTGLDGIFLLLHGAMASPSFPDVEGEALRRIRKKAGAQIPVGGVTDLHANFSPAMAEYSNALVTYRENPHTDARETAIRATHIFNRILRERLDAKTVLAQPPLMWAPPGTGTADEPMLGLERIAREIEASDANVLAVNIHAGFSFADMPYMGVSFTIITTAAPEAVQPHLARLCGYAMANKNTGQKLDPSPDEVFASLGITRDGQHPQRQPGSGPIILVEPSDNIGGGAPGDGTGMLQALLEYNVDNAGIIINDPQAVQQLSALQPGQSTHVSIGGKSSRLGGAPVELDVELISTSDGEYDLEDKQSHVVAAWGTRFQMGPSAVVHAAREGNKRGITILLTSRKAAPTDLGQWRSQGVEPCDLDYIVVKAAVAHRRAYDKISNESYNVGTPGPCTSDLKSLPFKNIRRPIHPLDEVA